MTDIASLGIRVQPQGVTEAATGLDKLQASATGAAKSMDALAGQSTKTSKSMNSTAIKDQRKELEKLLGTIDPTVKALGRLDDQETKLRAFRGKGLLDSDTYADYTKKITTQRNALSGLNEVQGKTAMSSKALAAATRGLPAQFTDIATSLAGGQRPLQVFLQQGGQLKDMFGGVGPAVKALGGYVLGLINPFTVAAVVVGGLAYAWKVGSDEAVNFNKALIQTGGYAGVTADQLGVMANAIGQTVGTSHEAAEALAVVAGSGKFSGEQLQLVAQAALDMSRITGQSTEETVAQFAKLRDEPVKALLALNDQYHFLTTATYEQVRALEDQGRKEEAFAVALRASAGALDERRKQIVDNAGVIERSWNAVRTAVKGAFDEMLNIGRASTPISQAVKGLAVEQSRLSGEAARFRDLLSKGVTIPPSQVQALRRQVEDSKKLIATYRATIESDPGAAAAAKKSSANKLATDAARFNEETRAYESKEQTRTRLTIAARTEANRLIEQATISGDTALAKKIKANLAQQEKGIAERYKDPKTPKGKSGAATANAEFREVLQGYKDDLATQQNAIGNAQKLLDEQFKAGMVTATEYYTQQRTLVEQSGSIQEASIQKQIAALKARTVAGKDAANTERQIGTLEAELAQVRSDTATKREVLDVREKKAIDAKTDAINAYDLALRLQNQTLKDQFDARVMSIGLGRREYEMQSELINITRERAKALEQLAIQLQKGPDNGGISQEVYDADVASLEKRSKEAVKTVTDGYAAISVAQADWRNGATSAFADYMDEAADVAGQTRDGIRSVLGSLEDNVAGFFKTGKFSIRDFLDDINGQLAQFFAKKTVSQFVSLIGGGGGTGGEGGYTGTLMSLFGGGSGGGFGFADGAAFQHGVQKFAAGGAFTNRVVDQPTRFNMAEMGEAGPEAIIPLHRGRDGSLGVRMSDAGGRSGSVYNITVPVTGVVDRRTRGQIANDTSQVLRTEERRR